MFVVLLKDSKRFGQHIRRAMEDMWDLFNDQATSITSKSDT